MHLQVWQHTSKTLVGLGFVVLASCGITSADNHGTSDYIDSTSYLIESIPECVPVYGTGKDPCAARPSLYPPSSGAVEEYSEIPAYWDLYYDSAERESIFEVHIVLRGTLMPNTTRCRTYESLYPEFVNVAEPGKLYNVSCFTDVRVNEYIVGRGPAELSVQSLITPGQYFGGVLDSFGEWVREHYEGTEGVLFLVPSPTNAVEAWWMMEFWDIQRKGDRVMVVAPYKDVIEKSFRQDFSSEELGLLEVPLKEFEVTIRKGAVARATETSGRIGIGEDLPMLITDANMLRPYFEGPGVGVSYETDAPAKPPPVPGGDDPEHPPGRVDDGDENGGSSTTVGPTFPMPGDEDTTPRPRDGDDTTTTTAP